MLAVAMPRLWDLKETSLYVEDMPRALKFYVEVMGLCPLVEDERFCALDIAGRHVLLLFLRGASLRPNELPGGVIPPHDGAGPLHVGFSIDAKDLPGWEGQLASNGVAIESRMSWPRGGRSLYFRDPDGHLLEILTPGVWATY